jgi:hypothetical protein
MESIALFTLILFLSIALYITHKRLMLLVERYNGFVLFAQEESEKTEATLNQIRAGIAKECWKDLEDWNDLNTKVEYLIDREQRAEERAKAVVKMLDLAKKTGRKKRGLG